MMADQFMLATDDETRAVNVPFSSKSITPDFDVATASHPKKIWIDLDNTPHVPFFLPILEALQTRGYEVILTARDSYQVCELLAFHHIDCELVGKHWGKKRALKVFGTCLRAAQLAPIIMEAKPDISVSHGSRAQFLTSILLGIPNIFIFDYEFTSGVGFLNFLQHDWVFVPNLIPESLELRAKRQVLRYPGLKEDVYAWRLKPDPSVKTELGLNGSDLIVTVRPPATEAHYHNHEAEVLLDATLDFLIQQPGLRVVLTPRNERQSAEMRKAWAKSIADGKIVIPERVVDGMNLIWFSDLVISGGGTMNREAAALGVPVYSIFRGRIGAVDQHLADTGRLQLLETVEDVRTKIVLERKKPMYRNGMDESSALQCIVNGIVSIAEHQCLPEHL
jgi:predicted glycosyltransferase